MEKSHARLLSALERHPALLAVKEKEDAERSERRRGWLHAIDAADRNFKRTDADLVVKASPIEKKLAAHRAQIAELEEQLEPLARARITTMSAFDEEVADLRAKLKADAEECADLLRCLDETHNGIAGRVPGLREFIMESMAPSHSRIVEALATVRDAHSDVRRAATEEVDVVRALDQIKQRLSAVQIKLVEI